MYYLSWREKDMHQKVLQILIADDDEEDMELIEESLLKVKPDATLYKVKNGKAVIDYLKSKENKELPALIILDYSMPVLNGAQVLSIISRDPLWGTIPVVVFSTSNSPLHIQECRKSGAIDYFIKPRTMQELSMIAEKILDYAVKN